MIKNLIIILISFFLFACSAESDEQEEAVNDSTEEAIEEDSEAPEGEGYDVSMDTGPGPEDNQDSLKEEFEKLEELHEKYNADFVAVKDEYYTISRESFSVYHGETETWYLDENFSKKYYVCNEGAEGGYEREEFKVYDHGVLIFSSKKESDAGPSPQEYFHLNVEGIVLSKCKSLFSWEEEARTFQSPMYYHDDYSFGVHTDKLKREDYEPGAQFTYLKSEQVESEYGGTEAEGFSLTIDSAVFELLYAK